MAHVEHNAQGVSPHHGFSPLFCSVCVCRALSLCNVLGKMPGGHYLPEWPDCLWTRVRNLCASPKSRASSQPSNL